MQASWPAPAGAGASIGIVLGPTRPLPRVGARARILHFGGAVEQVTVLAVYDGGKRLQVRGEAGEVLEFVLSPATASFVAASDGHGPRLELGGARA